MAEKHRDDKPADFLLPESVKNWFTHIYTHLISGNVTEMARLYDREFHNLTNNYFKQTTWPEPAAIESLVDEDPTFLLLYKQIYFRHMFSKLQPTFEYKVESWNTYCAIFDGILDQSLELDALPSQWIFDIVGEFVYQYQSVCQHRAKIAAKAEAENAQYEANPDVWSTTKVLNYLHALVRYSNIVAILKSDDAEAVKAPSETIKELGYFALICLSRAHVLYGDFYTSLKLLEPIDFYNKSSRAEIKKSTDQIHEKSPSCHVSVFYHMGVAQLMLEDFAAAIRSFSTIILQVHRSRNYYARFADYEQLNKLTEKALAMLTIALFLCPGQRVNEQIHTLIREKYSDKQSKLQKGDFSVLNDWFSFASPKFVLPNVPKSEKSRGSEAAQLQLKSFLAMVERQQHVASLRSYVKLYRSIDLEKLARFRGVEVEAVRAELLAYKIHEASRKSDVHFYLADDVVLVDDDVSNQRTGEFFLNHIHRFARIVDECAVE
ncbi:hypothetical protein Poli38472_000115 [Pythium oligandrum]|uniref:Eukaryotic translation initiation factor 3 subunit L n=1 Tax=Pythium oligandrum TaxID=41045 RepID=A0A8K1FIT3_PYTOL|nr:hypothetical protein Poli38472_000115 [Pythium oligandrum]|eukprot:TMW60073.1 hypothetical protein Poli38472_000115 [Pythium oligandrum]